MYRFFGILAFGQRAPWIFAFHISSTSPGGFLHFYISSTCPGGEREWQVVRSRQYVSRGQCGSSTTSSSSCRQCQPASEPQTDSGEPGGFFTFGHFDISSYPSAWQDGSQDWICPFLPCHYCNVGLPAPDCPLFCSLSLSIWGKYITGAMQLDTSVHSCTAPWTI